MTHCVVKMINIWRHLRRNDAAWGVDSIMIRWGAWDVVENKRGDVKVIRSGLNLSANAVSVS